MRIYNETTRSFAHKCISLIREILANETKIEVKRSRFQIKNHTYPISVEIFKGEKLGYFEASYYRIGINEKIMYLAKDKILKDLLRHELAHYLTYIEFGFVKPHGDEYKNICQKYNWPSEVSSASIDLNSANEYVGNLESEKVIRKVQALLSLAQSDNEHEAQLATIKANKLLLNFNIKNIKNDDNFTLYSDSILKVKRKDAKLACIYQIISHFLVSPIFSYGKEGVSLDVAGSKTNVEMAKYVANFLDVELDYMWNQTKRTHGLSGLRAKNSFLKGVGEGYDQKMMATKNEYTPDESKALVACNKLLEKKIHHYLNLRSSYASSTSSDTHSRSLGNTAGKNLTINKAISKASNKLLGILS